MNPNIPSIDQLKEIALPAPVSYAPQTWGWWALLSVLVLAVLLVSARRYWQWRRDRYRREALVRLAELQSSDDQLRALRELPELLKRVALSMPTTYPVAALGGEDWQGFLVRHSPQPLPADFSQQLAQLAYAPDSTLLTLKEEQRERLFNTSKRWVEQHHVAV
ncbi:MULTISPECIES: DUF4381 domain-containing protein [Pseudomonas]|jgi:hypothetical protein|uniref:DUF4381 domain-containing protein n=1 Tax=Pseudomonas TaxID=286 RepID=UPI0005FBF9C3|nr:MULTISPECIES: DUF4381 domain-containing protein [Pseudomonas]KJZ35064.1 alpha-2 type XI collagen [Pseudomonas fluorescens]OOG15288.1 alpha-2 type XI collagen [Pseudomonas sp. C9]